MNKNVRRITISAMLTALAVVLLYISAVLPTMRLAITVLAGLVTAVAIIECGISSGIMVFAAVSILGLLISPMRGNVIVYCLFFGYYPVIKVYFEKLRNRYIEWAAKILLFNIALTFALLLYRAGFMSGVEIPDIAVLLLYLSANAAFVIYDLGFSRAMSFYMVKLKKRG